MKTSGRKKNAFPAWHPNFRVSDDLPDIKAVRTDFIINIGSVLLALAILFAVVYREAVIHDLKSDINTLRAEETRLAPENERALELNREFLQEKQILDDLKKFFDIPVNVPSFLENIAEIRPGDVSFSEIAYQEVQRTEKEAVSRSYRIFLRGDTRDLNEIDILKETLGELPYLDGVDASITEGANPRNPGSNTFGFSIEVRFQPGKK